MIELLTVIVIIGILAQLALTGFMVYRGKAEFAKAESLYRNARTAATAGEEDAGTGFTMAYTETTDTGGPLAGALAQFYPTLNAPKDVILGSSVTPCAGSTFDPNVVLVVKPCRGDGKHIEYTRFCNGIETVDNRVAGNGC